MGTCIDCGEAAVTKIYNVAYGKEMPYCAEHAEQAHAWLQDLGSCEACEDFDTCPLGADCPLEK